MLAGAFIRLAISACVGSRDFSSFMQDTKISWGVDELYSMNFFSINEGYWGISGEIDVGDVLSSGRFWIQMASISAGVFVFNSFVYVFFPLVSARYNLGWVNLIWRG